MTFNPFKFLYAVAQIALKGCAILILILIGVFIFFNTPPGERFVKNALNKAIAPYALDVKEIKGVFPFRLIFEEVTVYENNKKLAECARLDLAWSLLSLMDKKLTITHLFLDDLTIHKLPTGSSGNSKTPLHLISYSIEDFRANNLKIDQDLAGMAMVLCAHGNALMEGNTLKGMLRLKSPLLQELGHRLNLKINDDAYVDVRVDQTIETPHIHVSLNTPTPLIQAEIKIENGYKNFLYEIKSQGPGMDLKDFSSEPLLSGVLSFVMKGTYDGQEQLGMTTLEGNFKKQTLSKSTIDQLFKSPVLFSGTILQQKGNLKVQNTSLTSQQFNISLEGEKTEKALSLKGKLNVHPLHMGDHGIKFINGQFDYQSKESQNLHLFVKSEIDGYPIQFDSKAEYDAGRGLTIKSFQGETKGATLRGLLTIPSSGKDLSGNIDLKIRDISRLNSITGQTLKGSALLKIGIKGTPDAPELKGVLSLDNVKVEHPQKIAMDSLITRFDFKNHALQFSSVLKHKKSGTLRAEGHIPLNISLYPFGCEFPRDAPLKAAVTGNVDLSSPLVSQFLGEDVIRGIALINIHVHGTQKRPIYDGSVSIKKGYWENLLYGTTLQDFDVLLEGDQEGVFIKNLSAKDRGTGTLSIHGKISHPFTDPRFFLTLLAKNFSALHNDEIQSILNASIELKGDLKKAVLSGTIDLLKTEMKIPDQMEETIPTIEIENPLEAGPKNNKETRSDTKNYLSVSCNLDVKSRRPLYVRGRGLTSEWIADFKMKGTLEQPDVKGNIVLKRGTFDLIGKTLVLKDGEVKFTSSSLLNPFFTVHGLYRKDLMSIMVQINGTPEKFDIKLSADPAMSEKEILSFFIFGKSNGELTMGQALQLASSLATLKGGNSLDVLGKVRSAFGLDALSFSADEEGGLEGGSLNLGKNVAEGVYVSIDKGLTPMDTRAVIDVDLAPSVVLETEVSPSSSGSVGLKYKWDY